ncbi:MAG TPA: phosphohistidine phosphatase SixA [Candidatus Krumholzibacteria bacterium]|nr:phosphohistidine phosphatase SixA [Candidatus Krumholzibacteria bacterium]
MRIVVMRHGIAIDRDHPDCPPDADRPLTDEGRQRTLRAVRGLKRLNVRPDRVISSPWLRAIETAEICADVLGLDPEDLGRRDELLPGTDPRMLVDHLRGLDTECSVVVGHAPHVDRLIGSLLGVDDRTMSSLKKSGAASIVLPTASSDAWLEWLATPKMLRRLGRT